MPFWTAGGDVHLAEDFIRLSPSIPGARGYIWSEIPNPYDEWEVEVGFRVTGQHLHGGRGLAIWYAKEKSEPGPIFGSKDNWDGLSVWLDSANPVTHKPSTMVLLNDGSKAFAAGADPSKLALGSCSISYRNPDDTAYVKVTYKENIITVSMDNGSGSKNYRTCTQRANIKLPKGYYFGVSAASHTPADDHDIVSFETRQLDPPKKSVHPSRPLEEEKKKRGEQFTGIDEEQKKKIQEAEFQVKKLRETSEDFQGETAVTMAAIYDTQRRAIEHLQILQLQIEAIGAPNPEDAITGNYKQVDLSKLAAAGGSSSSSSGSDSKKIDQETNTLLEQIRQETQRNSAQYQKVAMEQSRQMTDIQQSMEKLERVLEGLEKRIQAQTNMMKVKLNEVNLNSAETKGSLSTFLKYIFYAFLAQFLFGFAGYLYWKLRVERNDKKFV